MIDLQHRKRFLLLTILLAVVVILRLFVVEVRRVVNWQMYPSLYENDFYVLNKLSKSPKRGGVYFFEGLAKGQEGLFRVVGLPGDRVKYWAGRLYLNRRLVDEVKGSVEHLPFGKSSAVDLSDVSYMKNLEETLPKKKYAVIAFESGTKENLDELTVPEGMLFVLKDFRAIGIDSRKFGVVPVENISGEAFYTLYSCTDLLGKKMSICDFFKFRKARFFTRIP
ncbi:MAG: signal peptidase I [Bdellovibrionota bacterium]|nr:signal peptidase I [Bdellovibrionota bacterium]